MVKLKSIEKFNDLPKNSNAFIQLLRYASVDIFKYKFSIDMYRRIWTEFGKRTMNNEQLNLKHIIQ